MMRNIYLAQMSDAEWNVQASKRLKAVDTTDVPAALEAFKSLMLERIEREQSKNRVHWFDANQ